MSSIYSQSRSSVPPPPPQDCIYRSNELIIWKMNPLVVPVTSVKFNSASMGIIACVMSNEYFTKTLMSLVRLNIFEFASKTFISIQGNWAARDFITSLRKTSLSPRSSPLGTFRAEERLRLSGRNSILMTQINVYITNPVVYKNKFVQF